MKKRVLFFALFVLPLVLACGVSRDTTPVIQPEQSVAPTEQEKPIFPTSTPDASQVQQEAPTPEEKSGPNCLGEEVNSIGQSIADDYENADYEDVMTWFCNGAEFEDILVALETEVLTGVPAEEMLIMLADGLTWEEVWLIVGLTE